MMRQTIVPHVCAELWVTGSGSELARFRRNIAYGMGIYGSDGPSLAHLLRIEIRLLMRAFWAEYWSERPEVNSPDPDEALIQVGRTINGVPLKRNQVCRLIQIYRAAMILNPDDRGLDFGCGNGYLTRFFARSISNVVGLDFSERLIGDAKAHFSSPNVRYLRRDITTLRLGELRASAPTVAWALEVAQHLDSDELENLIQQSFSMPTMNRFLLGGIPERSRVAEFFSGHKAPVSVSRAPLTEPIIGRWWEPNELRKMAKKLGLEVHFWRLPRDFHSSSYRFEAHFELPNAT